ncbi:MAG: DegT/DnrJ/EryC1/StrS aminotransferase family protein [Lachnospiraceae bacterium]|nr:DegT/DnrJ/EryC1/StrS aminotransferase family protein [Lachnospiraceae bacterium]
MEFRDLKWQYQLHKNEIDGAIQNVLLQADFINGYQVSQLEMELAEYVGVKHCITCANGTDALQLALMTWNIGKGDAVFVPDFTFFSSGEVVPMVGATPIFVDIDVDTYNISPKSLEQAIQYVIEQTDLYPKVIVAVDLFGQPADYERIRQIADKYHLLVLEDAAQGFGGSIGDRKACSFGDISTTSFFPAKPLGCYGDGGAVFTDNDEWAALLRSYKVHGKGKDKYDNVRIGMNSRLDTLQAAVLLEKLKFFDEEIRLCNQVADEYTRQLQSIVKTPVIKENMKSSWAQYTISLKSNKQRRQVIKALREAGIPSAIYYKKPMHLQKAFTEYNNKLEYKFTESICDRCLSLPIHPYLEKEKVTLISNEILVLISERLNYKNEEQFKSSMCDF